MKENRGEMDKLWLYFIISAIAGSLTEALLNCFGMTLYYKSPMYFFAIIYILPIFIVIKFIPFGLLGILVVTIIRRFQQQVSVRMLSLYMLVMGAVYGFVITIFGALFTPFFDSIVFKEGYFDFKKIFFEVFSLKEPAPSGYIPGLPNLYYAVFSTVSYIILCIILLFILKKKSLNKLSVH